jgi:hypothetical protein
MDLETLFTDKCFVSVSTDIHELCLSLVLWLSFGSTDLSALPSTLLFLLSLATGVKVRNVENTETTKKAGGLGATPWLGAQGAKGPRKLLHFS